MFHLATSTLTPLLASYGYLAVLFFVAIESTGIPFVFRDHAAAGRQRGGDDPSTLHCVGDRGRGRRSHPGRQPGLLGGTRGRLPEARAATGAPSMERSDGSNWANTCS